MFDVFAPLPSCFRFVKNVASYANGCRAAGELLLQNSRVLCLIEDDKAFKNFSFCTYLSYTSGQPNVFIYRASAYSNGVLNVGRTTRTISISASEITSSVE